MSLKTADVKFVSDDVDPNNPPDTASQEEEEELEASEGATGTDDAEARMMKLQEQVDNLNKALREARGMSRSKNAELRNQIEALTRQLEEAKSERTSVIDALKDLDDDDVVTVAGVKRIVEAQKQMLETKAKQLENYTASMIVNFAEDTMRALHEDYDDVVEPYMDAALRDPALNKLITSQGPANVPKLLYDYAKKQAQITATQTQQGNEVTQTGAKPAVKKPVQGPKTMSTKSKAGPLQSKDLAGLSLDEKRKLSRDELDKTWLDLLK